MSKIAAIQMTSCSAIGPNLMTAQKLIIQAAELGAKVVVLPEYFACVPKQEKDIFLVQEPFGKGRVQDFMAKCAKENSVWIIAGTIPLSTSNPNKVSPACLVYNDQGEVVARYDKIHLFDARLGVTGEEYCESEYYQAGTQVVTVDTPVGKIGLSICYDLRFPELYRQLREQGADIFVLPAAFTAITGRMHWRTLLRTRAIENQCYMIAANQGGVHDNGRETHGSSMAVGPWGTVLEIKEVGIGVVMADVDLVRVQVLREEFPVWEHRKL